MKLVNHPSFWLRDDAAASLARLEKDHGVIVVNSAGRTVAEQQELINRYRRGGAANRPPYLYQPQTPASASNHVRNGGAALDTSSIALMVSVGAAYGWSRPAPKTDPVHFEYNSAKDIKKNVPKPSAPVSSTLKKVQQKLKTNYPLYAGRLKVDGIMGPNTRAAIKEFQRRSGLATDGIPGPKTLKALGL